MTVIIGGHRGSGCTDSPHARAIGEVKPPENTLESIKLAIKNGARLIEVDAIQTADNKLVVTHSNALADHVFTIADPGFVADHTYEELQKMPVGPHGTHTMPLLSEVLDVCKDVVLNIEIKDVKGTDTAKFSDTRPPLVDLLAEELKDHKGHLILSSFSLWDLEAMQERLPNIPRAQLFDTAQKEERPIYSSKCPDASEYLQFTIDNVRTAMARAGIQYVHPCIDSLHEDVVAFCGENGLAMNTWALNEPLPEHGKAAIENALHLCREHGVALGLITDYTPQMLELVKGISLAPAAAALAEDLSL